MVNKNLVTFKYVMKQTEPKIFQKDLIQNNCFKPIVITVLIVILIYQILMHNIQYI